MRQVVDAAGVALAVGGVTLLTLGGLDLGRFLTPLPKPRDEHALVTTGVYSALRHPMYGGLLLACAGLAIASGDEARLALAAALFWVLDQKASYEEEWLEQRYGAAYEQYRRRVKKLVPWIW